MFPSGNQRQIIRPHLASVANREEDIFLHELLGGVRGVWVGGRKLNHDDGWVWLDGTEFSYKNWQPGEPNNVGGEEDFIQINWIYQHGKKGKMYWNDAPNDIPLDYVAGFLCQYKAF